jgi:hypothetical protein
MIMSRWSTFPRYVATDAALGSAEWRVLPGPHKFQGARPVTASVRNSCPGPRKTC